MRTIGGMRINHPRFYIPPTLQSNYDNYLNTNVPGHTYNATLNGAQAIRCAFHADGKTPGEKVLRVSLSTPIRRGDIIAIEGEGEYLIPEVVQQVDCYACEPLRLNALLTITRKTPLQADRRGRITQQPGTETVCTDQLAHGVSSDGFQKQGVGIIVAGEPVFLLPLNDETRRIRREDEFVLDGDTYSIFHANFDQCDPGRTHGVVRLHCRRKAGESA